jgi:prepilin-type N-terminal cleavage/methylation domain-containing protein
MRLGVRRRDDHGFSLIELLVVIVILGILAAIVVFAVNGAQDKAGKAACRTDVLTVTVAAEAYNAKFGHYAASMDELVHAGLLHSIPSNSTYTVLYTVTADAATGNSSVDVSSSYCGQGSTSGTTSTTALPSASGAPSSSTGTDPGSKYCVELSSAHDKYGTFDLAGFDDTGLPAVRSSLSRLQGLATDDQLSSSWKTTSDAYTSVDSILEHSGLSWNDLKTLDSGQTPKGMDQKSADSIRSDIQGPLTTTEYQAAGVVIAGNAATVCGVSLS